MSNGVLSFWAFLPQNKYETELTPPGCVSVTMILLSCVLKQAVFADCECVKSCKNYQKFSFWPRIGWFCNFKFCSFNKGLNELMTQILPEARTLRWSFQSLIFLWGIAEVAELLENYSDTDWISNHPFVFTIWTSISFFFFFLNMKTNFAKKQNERRTNKEKTTTKKQQQQNKTKQKKRNIWRGWFDFQF